MRWRLYARKVSSMRNPKFKAIKPNYRKNVLEVTLQEGRRLTRYNLPFAVFKGKRIGPRNRFVSIDIDEELGRQGATFVTGDGTRGDLPADLVLYHCDPTYDWSPINQLKRALRNKLERSHGGSPEVWPGPCSDAFQTKKKPVRGVWWERTAGPRRCRAVRSVNTAPSGRPYPLQPQEFAG